MVVLVLENIITNPYSLLMKTLSLSYREYFMESVGVRYLRTSCCRIRNRSSEISDTKTTSAEVLYKVLSKLYCVYYIHSEI